MHHVLTTEKEGGATSPNHIHKLIRSQPPPARVAKRVSKQQQSAHRAPPSSETLAFRPPSLFPPSFISHHHLRPATATLAAATAMAKPKSKQLSYISLPHIPSSTTTTTTSPATASSLHALLLLSPSPPSAKKSPLSLPTSPRLLQLCLLFFLFLLSVVGLLMLALGLPSFLPSPCQLPDPPAPSQENSGLVDSGGGGGRGRREERGEFWRQPEGMGYRPCLSFSGEYQRASVAVAKERSKYLMVVMSGGLSQQRNQIVDAVVIARILGAALVVPILQVNVIWGDHR